MEYIFQIGLNSVVWEPTVSKQGDQYWELLKVLPSVLKKFKIRLMGKILSTWWNFSKSITNSSDSFTNFRTTNPQFFLQKWLLWFTLTVHKEWIRKQT